MQHDGTISGWLTAEGIKNAEAATMLGVSEVTIWRLKTGKTWPSEELARKIAQHSDGTVTLIGLLPQKDAARIASGLPQQVHEALADNRIDEAERRALLAAVDQLRAEADAVAASLSLEG
jgi:transcriptional regulator with XRE-family HTH domain